MNPESSTYLTLITELEDWKERALTAEKENVKLKRKIKGFLKRSDPIEKFKRKFEKD